MRDTVPATPTLSPPTPPGSGQSAGTSFWTAARLVAEREIRTHVRTKGFWILFGVLLAGLFAASILPGIVGGGPPHVATVGPVAEQLAVDAGFEVSPQSSAAGAEQLVRDGEVDAAVVPAADADSGVRVIALSSEPDLIMLALSTSPPVEVLEPAEVDEVVQYLVSLAFGGIFLMFTAAFGTGIAQSVVTEKQTRIVEILVATVPVRALLAGKIAGHTLLVFAQVAVLALAAPVALRIGEQGPLLGLIAPALGWFVPFFLLGFVLIATMWAVAGALVSRMEDLGTTSPVIIWIVMIPYFAVTFAHDNDLVMTILSYLPFSAAVAMPVRLFTGDAQMWEPLLAMALLVVAMVGFVLAASRLYAGSLLQTSGRVTLAQAWSGSGS